MRKDLSLSRSPLPAVVQDASEQVGGRPALDDPVSDLRQAVRIGDTPKRGSQAPRRGRVELPLNLSAQQGAFFGTALRDHIPAAPSPAGAPGEQAARARKTWHTEDVQDRPQDAADTVWNAHCAASARDRISAAESRPQSHSGSHGITGSLWLNARFYGPSCIPSVVLGAMHRVIRSAGSDPTKTCGFLAQWVFLRHTHRAWSLPADSSFQEGVRALDGRVAGVAGRAIRRPGSASERAPLIG